MRKEVKPLLERIFDTELTDAEAHVTWATLKWRSQQEEFVPYKRDPQIDGAIKKCFEKYGEAFKNWDKG